MGQNIVRGIGLPVLAVVTVGRPALVWIGNRDGSTGGGTAQFLVRRHLTGYVGKSQRVAAFTVGHLCHPVAGILIFGNCSPVFLDGGEFSVSVNESIHVSGVVSHR